MFFDTPDFLVRAASEDPVCGFSQQQLSLEAPPSPLSSRPKRSAVQCSGEISVWMLFLGNVFRRAGFLTFALPAKTTRGFLFSNNSLWKHPPPLCHLDRSAAQWRDLSVDVSLEMFFDRAGFPLRAASEDHAWLLFSNNSLWKHRPSLCHLDRSAAQWRDLSVDAPSWKCFSTEPDFCFAQLAKATFAPLREEPDADRQSHGSPQEIRGSAVEGPAVALPEYSHTLFRSPRLFLSAQFDLPAAKLAGFPLKQSFFRAEQRCPGWFPFPPGGERFVSCCAGERPDACRSLRRSPG